MNIPTCKPNGSWLSEAVEDGVWVTMDGEVLITWLVNPCVDVVDMLLTGKTWPVEFPIEILDVCIGILEWTTGLLDVTNGPSNIGFVLAVDVRPVAMVILDVEVRPVDLGTLDVDIRPVDLGTLDVDIRPVDLGTLDVDIRPVVVGTLDVDIRPVVVGTLDVDSGPVDLGTLDVDIRPVVVGTLDIDIRPVVVGTLDVDSGPVGTLILGIAMVLVVDPLDKVISQFVTNPAVTWLATALLENEPAKFDKEVDNNVGLLVWVPMRLFWIDKQDERGVNTFWSLEFNLVCNVSSCSFIFCIPCTLPWIWWCL